MKGLGKEFWVHISMLHTSALRGTNSTCSQELFQYWFFQNNVDWLPHWGAARYGWVYLRCGPACWEVYRKNAEPKDLLGLSFFLAMHVCYSTTTLVYIFHITLKRYLSYLCMEPVCIPQGLLTGLCCFCTYAVTGNNITLCGCITNHAVCEQRGWVSESYCMVHW